MSNESLNFVHHIHYITSHACPQNQVLDKKEFQKQMLEKLIWICSVMLVGARHGGVSVGVVEKEFRTEVSILCNCHILKPSLLILLISDIFITRQG